MKLNLILSLFIFILFSNISKSNENEEFGNNLKKGDLELAYKEVSKSIKDLKPGDDDYENKILFYILIAKKYEDESRKNNNFEISREVSSNLERIYNLEIAKKSENYELSKYFNYKNLVLSNFVLNDTINFNKYRNIMYDSYEKKILPKGLDEYYNFDFFKWEDKNIWGYEWFEKLPENRFTTSFTKIVYYVYSTKPDGTDDEQLYRIHVLMFHSDSASFDYVLTLKSGNSGQTLYGYFYDEDIDFKKLRNDVKEVLKGNLYPKDLGK